MKKKIIIITMLFLLVGCEKETILSINQTSVILPDIGGTETISLTANKPWTASSNLSWCKVSPSGGEEASSNRITITCDANTSYDARNASVTFTCAEKTVSVNVSQAINNGLLVSQTEYNITNAAQQLEIPVQANVKFSVEVDNGCKDWVKYNTTKGLSNSAVVLDIAKNEAYDGREGKVTIKQTDGNLSATVVIKQGQLDGLFLTTSEYNLSNEKHTLTVEVKSNIEFEVKSEVEWIKYVETKGLKTNQIILDVAENDTFDVREGKVIVKQKNGTLIGAITIKQDEKYGILVSQSEYELSNEAQAIEVEVKYNVDYSVVIPSSCKDWIKQVSVKGLNSKTYTFSIAKNATYDNREGSITFKEKNGTSGTTVSIKQAQTDYLEVTKKEYTVDVEGETLEIEVKSNVDYTVSISDDAQSWLSRVETKGISKDKVLIAISPGDDDTDRTGQVVISYGNLSHTVKIHQYAYAANTIIQFADEKIKAKLIDAFDTNKDGELSIKEAREVKSIEGVFGAIKTYKHFDEFQYFTGVTELPANLFNACRLESIVLPESITKIGSSAFINCDNLQAINIPASVTSIGDRAFCGCSRLTTIGGIPDNLTSLGQLAFGGCSNLVSPIVIPSGISRIEEKTFYSCSKLQTIVIPENVNYIGDGAFWGCSNLVSPIVIPSGISRIADMTFAGCSTLKTIVIPESVTSIGAGAFTGCTGLTSINIPESVTSIGNGAFGGCTGLTSINIPESVTSIGAGAFTGCTGLTSINIPESVISIGNGAFYGCTGLTSINIPESVRHFGEEVFSGCKSLNLIMSFMTNLEWGDGLHAFYNIADTIEVIAIPLFPFGDAFNSSQIHWTIPDIVTSIGDYAFQYLSGLTSVTIPESVTSIGVGAFWNCISLTSITIPKSIKSIENKAFKGCISIKNIYVLNTTPPSLSASSESFSGNYPIYVPAQSLNIYKSAVGWSDYADRIQAMP